MRSEALEDVSTPTFGCPAEPFDILVACRHQSALITLPLDKSFLQLALTQWWKLFGTLLQTAPADRTVLRVGTQLFYFRFALQPGSLKCMSIQPRHHWSVNAGIARPIIIRLRRDCL